MSPQDSFNAFWRAYPRKEARKVALTIWLRLKPDDELLDRMLTALEWQRQKPQWVKEGGQYVPLPSSWLNQERWTDEPPSQPESTPETHSQMIQRVLRESRDQIRH